MRPLSVTLASAVWLCVFACGGNREPPSCFEPYRTDIPIEQCVQAPPGQVNLPGRSDAEKAYALTLCDAPCVSVEILDISNVATSLSNMPVLSKIRQAGAITVSMADQSKNLVGLPRMERKSQILATLFVDSEALESFEGIPDDMIDGLRLSSPERLRSFTGLEKQGTLKTIEVSDTRFSTLAGLGLAPQLERMYILSDTGLENLNGLVGIQGEFVMILQDTRLRSLDGAGRDLKLKGVSITANRELSQCAAEAFVAGYGLSVDAGTALVVDNGPCM